MDNWTKYAQGDKTGKKINITLSQNFVELIDIFKSTYPEEKFTTTAVIKTMLEAGFRQFVENIQKEDDNEAGEDEEEEVDGE